MCLNETTSQGDGDNFLSEAKYWNNKPDNTGILVQDWGVISFFKKYLTEWNVIVNSLHKEKGCTTKKRKPNRQNTEGKRQAP
jgi:hypothetical protein